MAHLSTQDQRIVYGCLVLYAPLEITCRTVNEHCDEEDAVEVRDGRRGADDQAPGKAHGPVGYVVLYVKDDHLNQTLGIRGRIVRTGLREKLHQPLVRSRLLGRLEKIRMRVTRRI